MKKITLILVALLITFAAYSQTRKPILVTSGGKVVTRIINQTVTDTIEIRLIDSLFPYYDLQRDFGAVGDSVTDDTQAWNDAIDTLISKGGGSLYVPPAPVSYRLENVSTSKNYSNITIFGDGDTSHIFINAARGVLCQLAGETKNFTIKNLQIEVDAAQVAIFGYGGICNRDNGTLTNITLDRIYYHGEARTATTNGVQMLELYSSVGLVTNLTVKDCRYYSPGRNCYGVDVQKPSQRVRIFNNYFEHQNYGQTSNVGFNAIAIYTNAQDFDVYNNTINGSGHSAIAVSPGSNGSIYGNQVRKVQLGGEAGIEVEWKDHNGDHIRTSHSIMVSGNSVDSCTVGLLVTIRETAGIDTIPPYDITLTNNTITGCGDGVFVSSSFTAAPGDIIRNVIIKGNIIRGSTETDTESAGISVWDGQNISIVDNHITQCASNGIYMGKSTGFEPSRVTVTGNHVDTCTQHGINAAYGSYFIISHNMIDSTVLDGIRLGVTDGNVQIIGNNIKDTRDGIVSRSAATSHGIIMANNRISGSRDRPIDSNNAYLSVLGNVYEDIVNPARTDGANTQSDNNVTLP
jgi:hypothetical protein